MFTKIYNAINDKNICLQEMHGNYTIKLTDM